MSWSDHDVILTRRGKRMPSGSVWSDDAESGLAQGEVDYRLSSIVLRKDARNDASRFTYGDREANFA